MPENATCLAKASSFSDDWTQDHGDRLFKEGHVTEVPCARISVILGLLLLCLIPRLWAGTLHDILCPDAVSYLRWAEAFGNGDLAEAFRYTGLNIYVPLLAGLEVLPGDWLVVAKWWSVAMATLAVLPIYGWLRRQFNETLALLGCGFYALHPAMVHDSPLIVRDPTFWFLFATGLYVAWRAVSELRYRWICVFAVIFGLLVHLRTEGWLLAPVLLAWGAFRLRYARGRRLWLATVAMLAIASGPLAGACLREAVITQGDEQVAGQLRHLDLAKNLIGADEGVPVKAIFSGTLGMLVRYVKAFGYLQMVLAVFGLVLWGRRVFGPSKGPLLLYCLLSLGAIWACFCLAEMDRRYVFPSVVVSLPTIAAGLCQAAVWCEGIAGQPKKLSWASSSTWLLCLVVAVAVSLSAFIAICPRPLLYDQAEIGRWICVNIGPGKEVAVNLPRARLVEYYGDCRVSCRTAPAGPGDPDCMWFAQGQSLPSVILVWLDWRNPAGRAPFEGAISNAKKLGYREMGASSLPLSCRQIVVLVRGEVSGMKGEGQGRKPAVMQRGA